MPNDNPPVCSGEVHRWEVTRQNQGGFFTVAEFVGTAAYSHKRVYNPSAKEWEDMLAHAFAAGQDYQIVQMDAWFSAQEENDAPPEGICPVCYKPETGDDACECDAERRKYRAELRKRFSEGGEGAEPPRRRYQGGTTTGPAATTAVTPSSTASASAASNGHRQTTGETAREIAAGWCGEM